MKKFLICLLIFTLPACLIFSESKLTEIKLVGAKDRVLPPKLRASILEVAERCLNRSDETFIATIRKIESPFPTDKKSSVTEESMEMVVYDDASIFKVIQSNFSQEVRGILAKGDNYFLQLNGGGMLEAGFSFPAEIPQIEGQLFTVTIVEVNSRGYTLKMKDIVQEVIFEKSSGIIKDSDK